MHESDRTKHEDFTKRVGYSSITEIVCICLFPLILQCLRSLICIHFNISSKSRIYLALVIDYFVILLPTIVLLTFLSSYIITIIVGCFVVCFLWTVLPNYHRCRSFGNFHFLPTDILVAYLRSTIYMITCIMIYAIDLPVCPRRLAKSELNGLGLMDIGTGLFIVASSISGSKVIWFMNIYGKSKRFFNCALNSVVPCLVLGILRTLFIRASNYHQSITEYGVHWNFFYTIAIIRAISLIATTQNPISSYLLRFSIKRQTQLWYVVCSICLLLTEFSPILICPKYFQPKWQFNSTTLSYINKNRSTSLWLANFEGIISIFGYASIYFWGLGSSLLVRSYLSTEVNNNVNEKSSIKKSLPNISLFNILIIGGIMIICSFSCLYALGGSEMISRRFANSNYVLCIIFLKTTCFLFITSMIALLIHFTPFTSLNEYFSPLYLILNDKGLLYFIISNLLTGFLNVFYINTLQFLPEITNFNVTLGIYNNLSWSSSLLQFSILLIYSTLSIIIVLIGYYYDWVKFSTINVFKTHLK
ncbi:Phosphatidylinositol-glycan biosynthesis class W protein [Schistosoma japonicum]|nr:Phosphatidylinositol-glycan biosynthesis class W protein [Schistosoma japonicum]KAH8870116.1 Phosphatidylinositol-glycan biosynthesis class W protein [Schistosoma japonicum]KAH8870117.1 Phosphatidylinositol-glycan biosynthesis class W protein [Schistosoma japonicum]